MIILDTGYSKKKSQNTDLSLNNVYFVDIISFSKHDFCTKIQMSSVEDIKFWRGAVVIGVSSVPHTNILYYTTDNLMSILDINEQMFYNYFIAIKLCGFSGGVLVDEKEEYRNKIIEMVKSVNRKDILIYIFKITEDIIREDCNE